MKAIKVYCKIASDLGMLPKQLRGLKGVKECFEDDIRVSMRYLIDNGVGPVLGMKWTRKKMKRRMGLRVDKVYVRKRLLTS